MLVRDIMTPHVIGVSQKATLWEALTAMTSHKVSALAVLDDKGAPIGVLSEGDLLRRAELGGAKKRAGWLEFLIGGGQAADEYRLAHGRIVGEIMTKGALTIADDAPIARAADTMIANKVRRLIVVRAGKAVGICSRSDLLKALMLALTRSQEPRTDAEIQAAIAAEISNEAWAPKGAVHVHVADGIVTLDGAICDERLRGALKVLAENVPGVKKVRDKLAWVEPNSGYLVESPEDDD